MNRADFVLHTVRRLLKQSALFNVVNVYTDEAKPPGKAEVYPYILKTTLLYDILEDGKLSTRLRYVDVGIIASFSEAAQGRLAPLAAAIEEEIERCLAATIELTSSSSGGFKHTIQQITVTECLGLLDSGRTAGETAAVVTVSVVTEPV